MFKVQNFKADMVFGHLGCKNGRGGKKAEWGLDIKAKKPGEGVIRPNGALDMKAEKTGQGRQQKVENFFTNFSRFTRKSSQLT